jgi:hypothetical protein
MPTTDAVASRRKNAWLSVLLLLVSTVVSLLAAEVIVRLLGAAPAETSTRWSAHIRVVEGPEFRYYVHTNSIGLRDSREFSRDSPSTRVLFVGDSFTFGNGVSNEDTVAFKTEAILNQGTARSWTVINAGQPGTGTRAEEHQLKRILDLINVNAVVLFYFVDNDPYETQQEYERESTPGRSSGAAPTSVRIKGIVGQHSALYRFLSLRLATAGTLRAFPYTIFDQCDPAKLETFTHMDSLMRASTHEMERLTRERNLVFLVVLVPRSEQISAAAFEAFKQNYHVGQYPYDRLLPQKRVVEHVFRPEGIAPLDLMGALEGLDPDKYYYRLDGHFNPEGTSLVSAQIADLIRATVKPKK